MDSPPGYGSFCTQQNHTPLGGRGKALFQRVLRQAKQARRVRRQQAQGSLWLAWTPHTREPRDPVVVLVVIAPGPHWEGRRPQSNDGRPREVRQTHSTEEAGEQSGASCGVRGGKGSGQGKREPDGCAPNAGPGRRVARPCWSGPNHAAVPAPRWRPSMPGPGGDAHCG